MNMIELYEHQSTGDGLALMMVAALGPVHGDVVRKWVTVQDALLIEAIGRTAEDRPEWFPHGKWAVVQNIQARIYKELRNITWEATHANHH